MAKRAVDVEILRTEINRILDLFAQNGVRQVELRDDQYWDFDWRGRYLQPADGVGQTEASIGSLFDDLEFVLSSRANEPIALMLCHIAPLLNYLGVKAGDLGVFHKGE